MRYGTDHQVYEIDNMPGCTQVGISHGVFVKKHARGIGYGHVSMVDRMDVYKNLGYDVVICTVNATNIAQIRCLEKGGWVKDFEFSSSKSENGVQFWHKILTGEDITNE